MAFPIGSCGEKNTDIVRTDKLSGLRVLAAPVLDADGQSVAAISVAAPSMNINLKKFVEKTATPVMQAAAELGKVLQLSGTAPAGAVSAV